jgi:hypothetical protein
MVVLLNAPAVRQNRSLTKGAKIGARWGVKIGKTHPALRQRFQRGNKYHFFRCSAILHSHTSVDVFLSQ